MRAHKVPGLASVTRATLAAWPKCEGLSRLENQSSSGDALKRPVAIPVGYLLVGAQAALASSSGSTTIFKPNEPSSFRTVSNSGLVLPLIDL